MQALSAVLRRTVFRPVQVTGVAVLCAAVIVGCTAGANKHRAAGPSASTTASTTASGASAAAEKSAPRPHAATTPVAPPQPGNIHQNVRAAKVITKAPVALHAVADFGTGVIARITSVKAIHVQAVGPGQVSGPGLNMVIQVTNHTAKALNLNNAVVTVADAEGTPGVQMIFTPTEAADDDIPAPAPDSFSHPMTGSLAARATASGTYVFTIPVGNRSPITVSFSYSGGGPVVLFKGDAS
jgi:hypothetical protein